MLEKDPIQKVLGGGSGGRFRTAYRVLEEAITRRAFPGCAFGVLAGSEIQLLDALGHFTYELDSPRVGPETVFDIASVTKVAATTAMAMLLARRGQLNLDTLLGELLPAFVEGRKPGDPARRITLRHLLAHNSGLPGYVEFFRSAHTPGALISACARLSLEEPPEVRAEYSDPGFILLGKALETLAGDSLDRWTAQEIYGPLGMRSTRFCPEISQGTKIPPTEEDSTFRHRCIQGEVQDENAWVLGGVAGHAGLFSNVPDLLRFCASILEAAKPDASPVLFPADTLEVFSERQAPPGSSRALGWDTPSENSSSGGYFSRRAIGHLGFSGCSLWIDLDDDVAVVLLTNRTWPDRANQSIRQVRPAFHDAVRRAL